MRPTPDLPVDRPARVRPVRADEIPELVALHHRTWEETYGADGTLSAEVIAQWGAGAQGRWEARMSDPRGPAHWVAERDGQRVGLAWAEAAGPAAGQDPPPRPLELVACYVLAAEQGRGTGRRLVETALGDAPAFCWVLEGNERAAGFYRHLGFSADGARKVVPAWGGARIVRLVR